MAERVGSACLRRASARIPPFLLCLLCLSYFVSYEAYEDSFARKGGHPIRYRRRQAREKCRGGSLLDCQKKFSLSLSLSLCLTDNFHIYCYCMLRFKPPSVAGSLSSLSISITPQASGQAWPLRFASYLGLGPCSTLQSIDSRGSTLQRALQRPPSHPC